MLTFDFLLCCAHISCIAVLPIPRRRHAAQQGLEERVSLWDCRIQPAWMPSLLSSSCQRMMMRGQSAAIVGISVCRCPSTTVCVSCCVCVCLPCLPCLRY
jgi:hypothetical protein